MGTKFSGSNAAPEKSSPAKSSPEKKLSIFVSKISPATGVKLPKCLEGPHNTDKRLKRRAFFKEKRPA